MAFESAVGHGNLPNGNFSPVIYSKKVLNFFRTVAVAQEITNTDYEGEIRDFGDSVKILKEPLITVTDYKRGKQIEDQDILDEDLTLTIDQGRMYSFKIDDIERAHSHVDWGSMAQGSGAYALRDDFDTNILEYIRDNGSTNSALGASGSPKTIGYGAGNDYTPLDLIAKFAQILDENDIPMEGRWFVATPAFYYELGREDGKYIEVQVTGDDMSVIRAREKIGAKPIHDFVMLKSNNVPVSANSDVMAMAGHVSAVATAMNIVKSEVLRDQNTFADKYRGLMVYGRKVLRPEAVFLAFISLGDA